MLKPQDIVVLLKLVGLPERSAPYGRLALELDMSPSEVHAALNRAVHAQLARKHEHQIKPVIKNLVEFLVHGLRYTFPPELGGLTRGMPTSYAAEPLKHQMQGGDDPSPVWPDPEGTVRGLSFSPLYRSVPTAARKDEKLYELLALVDALRGGRARERNLAVHEIEQRLGSD